MIKKIIIIMTLAFSLFSFSFAYRDYLIETNLRYNFSDNSFVILNIQGDVGFKSESIATDYSLFFYDSKNILIDSINFSLSNLLYAPLIDLNTGEIISPPKQNTKEINLYSLYSPDIAILKIVDNLNGEVLLEKDISLQISQIEFSIIDNIMFDERVRDIGTAKKILESNYYQTRPIPTYESNIAIKNGKIIEDTNKNKLNEENIDNNYNNTDIEKRQEINIENETKSIENESNGLDLERGNNNHKLENVSNDENKINKNNYIKSVINFILIFLIIIISLTIYILKMKKSKTNN